MDRKDFVIIVWKKGIKPILFLGVIFFCIKFLINLLTKNGPERFFTIGIIGIIIIYTVIYFLGILFKRATDYLFFKLSDSVKLWFRVISKTFDYITPILLGVLIYHFWKEDWIGVSIIIGIVLIERINNIIKEEKLATIK